MAQDFDAFGAFSTVMKKSTVGAPAGEPEMDRRAPPVSPDRVALNPVPEDPPLDVDPEVRRILDETKSIAEVGDGPKSKGKVAGNTMDDGSMRPWQRIKKAVAIGMAALAFATVTVGPVLNAPDGYERAQVSIEQTYQEVTQDVQFEPDERESLRQLWVEGFRRAVIDHNQTPIPDNFGAPEPGIEVSFSDGFQPLLDHIEQTKVSPEIRGYNGAGGDAFEVRYRNAEGHIIAMEIPSERMEDGRWASEVLFDHLNRTGAQYTGNAISQSGGPIDAGPEIAPLAGDSQFAHLYNTLASTGGLQVETDNGATVTVTPEDGELKINMAFDNGREMNRTITEGNFDRYADQMGELVQKHQSQAFHRPGM